MLNRKPISNADFDAVTFGGERVGFFHEEIGIFRLSNPNIQLQRSTSDDVVRETRDLITEVRGADPTSLLNRFEALTDKQSRESLESAKDEVDALPSRSTFDDRLESVAEDHSKLDFDGGDLTIEQEAPDFFGANSFAVVVEDATNNPFEVREQLQTAPGFSDALNDLVPGVTDDAVNDIKDGLDETFDELEDGVVTRGPTFTVEQLGPLGGDGF